MTNTSFRRETINKLSKIMSQQEATSELDFLLREEFGINKKDELLNPNIILAYKNDIENIVNIRIKTRKPLQYIINKATFLSDIYYVDENVLIPRPETELLVNEILKQANNKSKILDIGTGSGCIAISLAKLLKNDNITTCDISENALSVAEKNHKIICPERKIHFVYSDLFKNIKEKYDIIVSNPPYIDPVLKQAMQPEVLEYEPHGALFAEEEGMLIYRKIIEQAKSYLNSNGLLAFEIGINQAEKVKMLLEKNHFEKVTIISDFIPIDRIILAYYNL